MGAVAQAGTIKYWSGQARRATQSGEGSTTTQTRTLICIFFKVQKVLSERVSCDQKSVSEHCPEQKGLQGQVGTRSEEATASSKPKTARGLDGQEWGCTSGLWGQGNGPTFLGSDGPSMQVTSTRGEASLVQGREHVA